MIEGYSDHAANERTFLAWVRTSVAVPAFGFVIEKFDLFLLTLLDAASLDASRRSRLEKLSGPSTHYEGLALIIVGIALQRRLVETAESSDLDLMRQDSQQQPPRQMGGRPEQRCGGDRARSRRICRLRRLAQHDRPTEGRTRKRSGSHTNR